MFYDISLILMPAITPNTPPLITFKTSASNAEPSGVEVSPNMRDKKDNNRANGIVHANTNKLHSDAVHFFIIFGIPIALTFCMGIY